MGDLRMVIQNVYKFTLTEGRVALGKLALIVGECIKSLASSRITVFFCVKVAKEIGVRGCCKLFQMRRNFRDYSSGLHEIFCK